MRIAHLIRRYWAPAVIFVAGVAIVALVGIRTESLTAIMYTSGINGVIFGIAIGAANRRAAGQEAARTRRRR
ncbi:MAG: hypothetical protein ACKVVT_01340 [Dehalococcoidia bacterium]